MELNMEPEKILGLMPILSLVLAAGAAVPCGAAPDGQGVCEGCSSAVGTVNVTLVDPPPFTGMFLSAFDFRPLAEAFSAFLSALSSAVSPA